MNTEEALKKIYEKFPNDYIIIESLHSIYLGDIEKSYKIYTTHSLWSRRYDSLEEAVNDILNT